MNIYILVLLLPQIWALKHGTLMIVFMDYQEMRRLYLNKVFILLASRTCERLAGQEEVRPPLITDICAHIAQAAHATIGRLDRKHEGIAHIYGLERRD